jgi:predicted O-methyltransferase YrrM
MKTLTSQLFELGKGIIEKLPEVSDNTGKFSMANDGGVEIEVGEFLYGVTRVLKPTNILETGTYTGISSMYIAQGLKDNNFGQLITLETSAIHKEQAEKLWDQVGIIPFVTCQLVSSLEFKTELQFDLIFLDSEPEFRFKELVKFYNNLKLGGFLFIHDLPPTFCQGNINSDHPEFKDWPFGTVPEQMKQWIKEDKLRPFSFPSPRGFVGFYKTNKEDYHA